MKWIASAMNDPVTHEWLKLAGFSPDRDDEPDDRPIWLLLNSDREEIVLAVEIHPDGRTCTAHFGPPDAAERFPWDIYEKAVIRHLCEAVGCRLTV